MRHKLLALFLSLSMLLALGQPALAIPEFQNNGNFTNHEEGIINNNGAFENSGKMENQGAFNNGGELKGSGIIEWVRAVIELVGSKDTTAPTSGAITDAVSWSLSKDGVLTISGKGEMPNYSVVSDSTSGFSTDDRPWAAYDSKIEAIVVGDGITRIGNDAFMLLENVSTASLPASINAIGDSAFEGCTSLATINIPKAVESIAVNAFSGCALENVSYGGSKLLWEILTRNFEQYPVFIGAFADAVVTYGETSTSGAVGENDAITWTIDENGQLGLSASEPSEMPDFTAANPAPWTEFADAITSVVVGDNITSVGAFAFAALSNIVSVGIGDDIEAIADSALANGSNPKLTQIVVAKGNQAYCAIDGVLYSKDMTALLLFPAGKKEVTAYTIPNTVTSFARDAFANVGLKSISYMGTRAEWGDIENLSVAGIAAAVSISYTGIASGSIQEDDKVLKWSIDDNGKLAVSGDFMPDFTTDTPAPWHDFADEITEISIGSGIVEIGENAFAGLTALEAIEIPATVKVIWNGAFAGCTGLKSVVFKGSVDRFWDNIFVDCAIETVVFPNVRTKWDALIGDNASAFANATINCTGIASGDWGAQAIVGSWLIDNDGVLSVSTESTNGVSIPNYAFESSVATKNAPWAEYAADITSIVMSGNITGIGINAFKGLTKATSVTIPSSVTIIYDEAFADCASLQSVDIPSSVTYIGVLAFANCKAMTTLTLHDGLQQIDYMAFSHCEKLTSVTIPSTVETLGVQIFAYCYALETATILAEITAIPVGMFYNCSSLTSAVWPTTVESIGDNAFVNCSALAVIPLNEGLESIGANAFNSCEELTTVDIPSTVTEVGENAFANCTKLSEVTIPPLQSLLDIFSGSLGINIIKFLGSQSLWEHLIWGNKSKSSTPSGDNQYPIPELVKETIQVSFIDSESSDVVIFDDSITWDIDTDGTMTISGTGSIAAAGKPALATTYSYKTYQTAEGTTYYWARQEVEQRNEYTWKQFDIVTTQQHKWEKFSTKEVPAYQWTRFSVYEGTKKVYAWELYDIRTETEGSDVEYYKGNTYTGFVMADDASAYPENGVKDGTWYLSIGQISEKLKYEAMDTVTAETQNAYPNGYSKDDGFWYEPVTTSKTLTVKGDKLGTVTSDNETEYPENGPVGKVWYVYSGIVNAQAMGEATDLVVTDYEEDAYPMDGAADDGYWYKLTSEHVVIQNKPRTSPYIVSSTRQNAYPLGAAIDAYMDGRLYVFTTMPSVTKTFRTGTEGETLAATTELEEKLNTIYNDLYIAKRVSESTLDVDASELEQPWGDNRSSVKKIVIEDGITGIGALAFYGMENLTEVSIPASVSAIEPAAFAGCPKLEEIVISNDNPHFTVSVDDILTSDMKEFILHAPAAKTTRVMFGTSGYNVEKIAPYAFYGASMSSIGFASPETSDSDETFNLTTIGEGAFTNTTVSDAVYLAGKDIREHMANVTVATGNSLLDSATSSDDYEALVESMGKMTMKAAYAIEADSTRPNTWRFFVDGEAYSLAISADGVTPVAGGVYLVSPKESPSSSDKDGLDGITYTVFDINMMRLRDTGTLVAETATIDTFADNVVTTASGAQYSVDMSNIAIYDMRETASVLGEKVDTTVLKKGTVATLLVELSENSDDNHTVIEAWLIDA